MIEQAPVNELAEPKLVMQRAQVVAEQFAAIPAPLFAQTKRQIHQPSHERDPAQLAEFAKTFAQICADPKTHEAIRAYAGQTFKKG